MERRPKDSEYKLHYIEDLAMGFILFKKQSLLSDNFVTI